MDSIVSFFTSIDIKTLDQITICIGVIAIIYPLRCAYLLRKTTKLGKAISLHFFGESYGMAMTTLFALLAFTGLIIDLDGHLQSYMRISMFIVAILTSRYLLKRYLNKDG